MNPWWGLWAFCVGALAVALGLCALAYLGDDPVNPWPGVPR